MLSVTSVSDSALADYAYASGGNDVHVYFPSELDASSGVKLTKDDIAIELIPLGARDGGGTAVMSAEGTTVPTAELTELGTNGKALGAGHRAVNYSGAFNKAAALRYTPTLNGFKEELVLYAYTGMNEYSFTLKTGGLRLAEHDGVYYLEEPNGGERRLAVGELLV